MLLAVFREIGLWIYGINAYFHHIPHYQVTPDALDAVVNTKLIQQFPGTQIAIERMPIVKALFDELFPLQFQFAWFCVLVIKIGTIDAEQFTLSLNSQRGVSADQA